MARADLYGASVSRRGRDRIPGHLALFCRSTQQSVLRLLTTPKILQEYGSAVTNHDAIALIENYLAKPGIVFAPESESVFPRWLALANLPTASPKR